MRINLNEYNNHSRIPDFLVVGTQKGGTTSLFELLRRHPQIFLHSLKELQYFSLYYNKPESWYLSFFGAADNYQLCGDVTPYYLFHPFCAERIFKLSANIKIIILLRDPIERAISQYFHAVRHGFEDLGINEAFYAEKLRLEGASSVLSEPGAQHFSHQKHSYMSRGLYELQIRKYKTFFPDKNIFIAKSEDFYDNTQLIWANLLNFLEVDPMPLPGLMPANAGKGEKVNVPMNIRVELRRLFADTADFVNSSYGFSWGW